MREVVFAEGVERGYKKWPTQIERASESRIPIAAPVTAKKKKYIFSPPFLKIRRGSDILEPLLQLAAPEVQRR